jgi:hypothetical protein
LVGKCGLNGVWLGDVDLRDVDCGNVDCRFVGRRTGEIGLWHCRLADTGKDEEGTEYFLWAHTGNLVQKTWAVEIPCGRRLFLPIIGAMKRWLPLLAVVLLAATAEESRLYRVAQGTFGDKLYDVAERQFAEFLARFPQSEKADSRLRSVI